MKKRILLIAIIVILILLPVGIFTYTKMFGEDILPGKYEVVNSSEYPDAYIEVKNDKFYIHNVDLNSKLRDAQLEYYYKIENNKDLDLKYGFSEEELEHVSNLNVYFEQYGYDYNKISPIEEGSYEFWYPCLIEDTMFGIHIVYNSWDKTITITNLEEPLVFER